MSDRSRSPSPVRDEPRPKKQKTSGFKWKEKAPRDPTKPDERDAGKLERGYRNRSPRRDNYREREQQPPRQRNEDGTREDRPSKPATDTDRPRTEDRDRLRGQNSNLDIDSKFGTSGSAGNVTTPTGSSKAPKKERKEKKPKSTAPAEPMIIVNINDRLGTKAAIPCLASDSVKAFKAIVAAHIGRQPHEIMLKRQGERPFKDQLTLQDYGVSSGVQLDLELDTGD